MDKETVRNFNEAQEKYSELFNIYNYYVASTTEQNLLKDGVGKKLKKIVYSEAEGVYIVFLDESIEERLSLLVEMHNKKISNKNNGQ